MKPQVYILDTDPVLCAQSYTDVHINEVLSAASSILEAAALGERSKHPLRKHILVQWARGSTEYTWLFNLYKALLAENKYRFGVIAHRTGNIVPPAKSSVEAPKRFVQLIPVTIPGLPEMAFRAYYHETQQYATWTKRGAPKWWAGSEQLALTL